MYLPDHFSETEAAEIDAVIDANPLAVLLTHTPDGLVANHIPILKQGDRLIGHIALANNLHEVLADDAQVLAVFRGEDSYISPNWYPSKAATHKQVPTWNYQAVHISGPIRWIRDTGGKRRIVHMLTRHFEQPLNGDDAWSMGDAPEEFLAGMIDAIIGFEIIVQQVIAKSKLGQNKEAGDFSSVTKHMKDRQKTALATRMERHGLK